MSGVLVDTSIWVDHFRRREDKLAVLLAQNWVLMHPLVLGEIACGTPPSRRRTLSDLALLRQAVGANLSEVIAFIERERLYGLGCGFVDLSLLASTLMTPSTTLWTRDRRLASLAKRFGVAH